MRNILPPLIAFLLARIERAGSFVWAIALDLTGFLLTGLLFFFGAVKLQERFPTLGLQDPGIILQIVFTVAIIYLSLVLSHAVCRRLAPTLTLFGDQGKFAETWKKEALDIDDLFRLTAALVFQFAVWVVILTALLLSI